MPDSRLLAPILEGHMTETQLAGIGDILHEWAGVGLHQATVDDLTEARAHQKIYLDALEKQHARRHAAAGVVSLAAYRKARR
ncbi:hypothetical protein G6027_17090 [Dietzia sp. SLG310A2-38A2]|uniref:hypothetical protein n=1 Tax=Dietzia sp. SLG310A2-38A2 TaxID=1630643 RepID=UPI0015F9AD16|nr:hypothetical protein [Dietzia sp. SLG310A2-38A2]MBB1032558.1 hypothetical protein [Dietzia sp. SLG310A2-38A2]